MHEHFQKSNYVLMYEGTSEMAADIHTKGFKNPLAWKGACMLMNLLDPGDLLTKELNEMVKPTTDVDTTVRQVFRFSNPEPMKSQIFHIRKPKILPPEVSKRVYQPKSMSNNFLAWILFWL